MWGFNQSDAKYVVTSANLLPKLAKLRDQFQHLQTIVYIRNGSKSELSDKDQETVAQQLAVKFNILSFDQVEANGEHTTTPVEFPPPAPDDLAIIIYTSG